jgi:putative FmdB family regulatory protein
MELSEKENRLSSMKRLADQATCFFGSGLFEIGYRWRKDEMPVYRFECPQCGTYFDKRLSFSDDFSSVTCPNGHHGVRHVFSAPTVVYKGSGFYVTDSRPKAAKES